MTDCSEFKFEQPEWSLMFRTINQSITFSGHCTGSLYMHVECSRCSCSFLELNVKPLQFTSASCSQLVKVDSDFE
ncbi:hypothetical protein DPMN_057504 [Dreissena polymorpha]|uniref:Uncharacterized protein n=1 Tax=Dreissena polymorpha TaxID=45954 RepID=A0A9D4C034_DREPO|nr:hypothetical protein DPMN_057504 [Dreissena polymorpha]